jgi:hypothetical protein
MKRTFTVEIEARNATQARSELVGSLQDARDSRIIEDFIVTEPRLNKATILEFNSNHQTGDEEIIFVQRRRAPKKYVGFILKVGALGWTFFSADDKLKEVRKPLPLTSQTMSEIVRFLEAKNEVR